MPTREEEARQWQAISLNSRKAAQHLLEKAAQHLLEVECYRSSVSRSYYAAYAAITSALIRQGITLGHGGNNPGHAGLPVYVLNNLTLLSLASRFEINKALRRLYRARAEVDYVAAAVVNNAAAKKTLRDLSRVLQLLAAERKGEN